MRAAPRAVPGDGFISIRREPLRAAGGSVLSSVTGRLGAGSEDVHARVIREGGGSACREGYTRVI